VQISHVAKIQFSVLFFSAVKSTEGSVRFSSGLVLIFLPCGLLLAALISRWLALLNVCYFILQLFTGLQLISSPLKFSAVQFLLSEQVLPLSFGRHCSLSNPAAVSGCFFERTVLMPLVRPQAS
jgi:hypothetical protein